MNPKKGCYHGKLSRGCQLCITGEKSVLFVTGVCPRHCFYCPISDKKFQKDVIYINETPSSDFDVIAKEIELCKSKGVGITGGDPLARIQRTAEFIFRLKRRFGKGFHIHLYTPLELFTEENLKKLCDAGLDEIRCHPDIMDKSLWERVSLGRKFRWNFGMEIPVLPGKEKETEELIDFVKDKVDSINLNELEFSDAEAYQADYESKDEMSYGAKGSEEVAFRLLEKYKHINIHYCTAGFKDDVQMRERIKKRAKSIKQPYDELTDEGTLIRGAVYLEELKPGVGYRKKIGGLVDRQEYIGRLIKLKEFIINTFGTRRENIAVDGRKCRILIKKEVLMNIKEKLKEKGFVPAIVEEYPTYDEFEVEIEFL